MPPRGAQQSSAAVAAACSDADRGRAGYGTTAWTQIYYMKHYTYEPWEFQVFARSCDVILYNLGSTLLPHLSPAFAQSVTVGKHLMRSRDILLSQDYQDLRLNVNLHVSLFCICKFCALCCLGNLLKIWHGKNK